METCKICDKKKELHSGICFACRTTVRRLRVKEECLRRKGGKCEKCGYDKCNRALSFHHINPKEKEFNLARIYNKSYEVIFKELDKCILVCMNCHAELHAEIDRSNTTYRYEKYLQQQADKFQVYEIKKQEEIREIEARNLIRIEEYNERGPSEEYLRDNVWIKPVTTIAKEFSLSGNAIIKRCKKYRIDTPPRGYWQKLHSHMMRDAA